MKKILIAGPVGSGKTSFAKQLSTEKKITYYELDNLIWNRQPTGDKPYSELESTKQLQTILAKESWIIEGTATKEWIKPAIDDADIVLLLLPPYFTRVYRIFSRFIKQITNKEVAHYKPTLNLLRMMFVWNHHFETKNIFELKKLADLSDKKLTILRDSDAYSCYKREILKTNEL
ncbi:hypothetical protein ATZ33_04135 [Enterococcus silesiacus]|uniref:DNA topology modulation protein FlaR n=1 Tax=Enterococcus silesiacus TaxID=332949 RepID=A0A0S3K8I9_9ENTE|nr:hypothetical protein [Enterococcus silesiacus]ALS00590.1 hypothetical protein ATZ33_04135 [Enterococcus silesiacus]OJG86980.1 hypothetical protein RV15_GL002273 [Enterococcus silesiacus]